MAQIRRNNDTGRFRRDITAFVHGMARAVDLGTVMISRNGRFLSGNGFGADRRALAHDGRVVSVSIHHVDPGFNPEEEAREINGEGEKA